MWKFVFILIAYLIGSIPFSYILGKSIKHEDIRKFGSGNIGTSNAFRVFGKLIGVIVLLLDTSKGGIMVFLLKYTHTMDWLNIGSNFVNDFSLIYGFAAVLGHVFPVWFKFRGGKGVATSFGLLLAYSPIVAVVLIPIFLGTVITTHYASLASTGTTVVYMVVAYTLFFTHFHPEIYDLTYVIITTLATFLILIRHSSNFVRIKKGNENRTQIFVKLDAYLERKKQERRQKKNG